jgi:hypothetical protein
MQEIKDASVFLKQVRDTYIDWENSESNNKKNKTITISSELYLELERLLDYAGIENTLVFKKINNSSKIPNKKDVKKLQLIRSLGFARRYFPLFSAGFAIVTLPLIINQLYSLIQKIVFSQWQQSLAMVITLWAGISIIIIVLMELVGFIETKLILGTRIRHPHILHLSYKKDNNGLPSPNLGLSFLFKDNERFYGKEYDTKIEFNISPNQQVNGLSLNSLDIALYTISYAKQIFIV